MSTLGSLIIEDVFEVQEVDPDGKKFQKGAFHYRMLCELLQALLSRVYLTSVVLCACVVRMCLRVCLEVLLSLDVFFTKIKLSS
jgi:hypothetical protein